MKTGCKLAVIGSRTFTNFSFLCEKLNEHQPCHIISGGAVGADTRAERYAALRKIPLTVFPADWSAYGRQAGFIRNLDIIANCEELVAFHDGNSPGTAHSIKAARLANKPVYVYWPREKGKK